MPNDKRDMRLSTREDQLEMELRDFTDAVGFHYNRLVRWGMDSNYAAQLAAAFQSHLQQDKITHDNSKAVHAQVRNDEPPTPTGVK